MSIFSRKGPCNSDKCHCPECRLTKVEGRVSTLEARSSNDLERSWLLARARERSRDRAEMYFQDAAPTSRERSLHANGLPINSCSVHHRPSDPMQSPIYNGYRSIWRWEQPRKHRPNVWRRRKLGAFEEWMGPEWDGTFTPYATPWGTLKPTNLDAVRFEVTNKIGVIEKTESITLLPHGDVFGTRHAYSEVDGKIVWTSNPVADSWIAKNFSQMQPSQAPRWACPGNHARAAGKWHGLIHPADTGKWQHFAEVETDIFIPKERTMTPIMLQVLLHAAYICEDFRPETPASRSAVTRLYKLGLIERTTDAERVSAPDWAFKTSEKGKVYVEALCSVPLPVQAEPKWEMPK